MKSAGYMLARCYGGFIQRYMCGFVSLFEGLWVLEIICYGKQLDYTLGESALVNIRIDYNSKI